MSSHAVPECKSHLPQSGFASWHYPTTIVAKSTQINQDEFQRIACILLLAAGICSCKLHSGITNARSRLRTAQEPFKVHLSDHSVHCPSCNRCRRPLQDRSTTIAQRAMQPL